MTDKSQIVEQARIDIMAAMTDKKGADLTEDEIKAILGTYFTADSIPSDLSDLTQILKTKTGGYDVALSEVLNGVTIGAVEPKGGTSKLTPVEKTALEENGIAEITGDDIANDNLKENDRIKAVLTGDVPLTEEMTYVEGTKDTGVVVSIDGSEFVWVPVPEAIYDSKKTLSESGVDLNTNKTEYRPMAKLQSNGTDYEGLLYTFSGTTSTYKPTYNVTTTNYREPAVVSNYDGGSSDTVGIELTGENGLQAQYNTMVASVAKYGGFYVGRYELGLEGTNVVSKPASATVTTTDASQNTTKKWYGLYSKCKSYSADNLTSTMMWGSQYDAMMNWMAKTGKTVGTADSSKYNTAQTTGSKEEDKLNNVYDLYGCHCEWTLEAHETDSRVPRGGLYSSSYSASRRNYTSPLFPYDNNSSRLSLYINL